MSETGKIFLNESEKKAFDKKHRNTISFNISKYETAVAKGKLQYQNIELAKKRAAHLRHKSINNLDKYITEFEANFIAKGGKIIWAPDEKEAIKEILGIMKKCEAQYVVKSKSMITEEIELNHYLQENNIESLETDLGEYIVQLAGEKPYHIITPCMHKSKEDISELFFQKFGFAKNNSAEQLTAFVRRLLRDKFTSADVGITGVNFLIADIGGMALTENEGNGLMSVSFPKTHIAICGIEKIIPSLKDLDLFWPLLATHGTGQNVTVYNTILTGPKQEGETDGPNEMYLVLVDNYRSNVLILDEQRRAMSCIKCGACLNACPIYKSIGGHTYNTTYSGPIGSVITPHMRGKKEYKHLSYASTLCGKCSEVCPVLINLHKLLLFNRRDFVKEKLTAASERKVMYIWKKAMMNRKMIEAVSPGIKNLLLKKFFSKAWGSRRTIPTISQRSFNRLWKEQRGHKKK